MSDLARSFGDVAEAYDLGRPRYPPAPGEQMSLEDPPQPQE